MHPGRRESPPNRCRIAAAAALLLLGASATAHAQPASQPADPPAGDLLGQYRQQMIEARFSMFSGLKLQRGERDLDLGFAGSNLEEIFAGSPAALDAAGTYRTLTITGTVLWAAGLATLVAELVLLAADRDTLVANGEIKPLFWALLGPGAAIGISGGLMMQGANVYLNDAVSYYNRDLAQQLRGGAPGPRVGLSLGGAF